MRIAIVGGGAAGLMAAAVAASKGAHIDVYEAGEDVGKKILASGNGRCNISNTRLLPKDYFGTRPEFVAHALKRFDFNALERFCEKMGLYLYTLSDGRAYPLSDEAKSVQQAFKRFVLHRGVNLLTQTPVEALKKEAKGWRLISPKGRLLYDRVLIAAGSPAAPQLGGSVSGLALAQSLGHTIVPTYPALVGLHLQGKVHERLSGVKKEAALRLLIEGREAQSVVGDLLFTRYGISGFAVLDISTRASLALRRNERVTVSIDLMPTSDRQEVTALLQKSAKRVPWAGMEAMLHGILPQKIVKALLRELAIEGSTPCEKAGAKTWRRLASTIKDWRFEVIDTHGFRHAEAAGGGVSTDEIDPKTMASKIHPGLYFAGEVLDIVGRRGGYNFHFAWASGYAAAEAMSRKQ